MPKPCFVASVAECSDPPAFRVTALGWWRGRRFGSRMVCNKHIGFVVAGLGWPCRVEFVLATEPLDVIAGGPDGL